ncbi:MAG: hypothetical protein QOI06_3396 [Nocardioidaceae bacterium]|nr:hypothetical protein [Nocardioidaceae bacterium]
MRTRRVSRWWAHRSLTFRLTIVATVVLAVGLVSGAVGLATFFFHNRVDAVDVNVRVEAATVSSLVRSGQLPNPLPAPADQPVFAQVVGADGTVRAATPSASQVVPVLPLAVLRAHAAGHPFTTTESALGTAPLRVIVTPAELKGAPVTVVTAVPFTDVRGTLAAMLRALLISVPLVLLAAGIATWLAVGSALRPVDRLREAADQVADTRGRTAPHLPVPDSGDELARLAETLNRMLERLHQATEQQRTFVADAAHELRSPIASIRAQLDVALSTGPDAREWAKVAHDVRTDVERVGRLADDLLLLAKLDSGGSLQRDLVDVSALLDLTAPPLWVRGDPRALRRAFDNLVSNATRHAVSRVKVTGDLRDGVVVVSVEDDGPGIPVADRERVFDRWLRLDDGRARDEGGAGLGLAIARSVARSHDGDVTLAESPLGGVRAELRLPTATDVPSTVPAGELRPGMRGP